LTEQLNAPYEPRHTDHPQIMATPVNTEACRILRLCE